MAHFKGKCGEKEAVTASYGQPMWVVVDVKNKGKCDVEVVLRNGEEVIAKETIPAGGEPQTVDESGVDRVSIACKGKKADGKCDFFYEIQAVKARFKGKCGGAEGATATFDREMEVAVFVDNQGDCDVLITLSKPDPSAGPPPELTPVKKRTVKAGKSRWLARPGVTDVRIGCLGDSDDKGECRFRYFIDAI